MPTINLIMIVLALVCFGLSTVGVPSPPRCNLQSLGLFALTLAWLLGAR